MDPQTPNARQRGPAVLVTAGLLLIAIFLVVIGLLVEPGGSGGHATLHGLTSAVVFAGAMAIVMRRRHATIGTQAPALGLVAFGIATLVEGIGAYGFVGDERTDFAVVHDLGIGLAPLGLIALVVGASIGVNAWARGTLPRGPLGRTVAAGIGVVALLGGLAVFVTLTGLAPLLGS